MAKAKKNSKPAELTIEEKAALVIEYRNKAKEYSEKAAKVIEELADFCDEQGLQSGAEIGPLKAVYKSNPVRLEMPDGLTPTQKLLLEERLMSDLPEYVKVSTKLDIAKIQMSMATDSAVRNALAAHRCEIVQTSDWTFRQA